MQAGSISAQYRRKRRLTVSGVQLEARNRSLRLHISAAAAEGKREERGGERGKEREQREEPFCLPLGPPAQPWPNHKKVEQRQKDAEQHAGGDEAGDEPDVGAATARLSPI